MNKRDSTGGGVALMRHCLTDGAAASPNDITMTDHLIRPFSHRVRHLLRLALLALLPLATPAAHADAVLTLCFEKMDVLPWRTVNGEGLDFEMLKQVAQRLNITFHYQSLPWKRCLAELKDNSLDGAFSASFKPDRLEIGAYPGGRQIDNSLRMHVDRYVLVRRKGSTVQWDGKTFQNLDGPIGAQLGYSIADQLRAMGVTVDEGSQRARELALKLLAGRLAAAAVGGSEAALLMSSEPKLAAQLEVLPVPLVEKPYFLMLSHGFVKANPDLANKIWKTMEIVRSSPDYRKREREMVARVSK